MSSRSLHVICIGLIGCSDYELQGKSSPESGADDTAPQDTSPPPPDETCEDARAPEPYAVTIDETCVAEPQVGTFDPVVEWQWSSDSVYGAYDQVMASPAVANLNDDNGDGFINGDDIPDIVVASYSGGRYTSEGIVTAMSGDGSGILWSVFQPGGVSTYGCSGVALGDLNGDGSIEVCVSGVSSAVVCLNGLDGSLLWAAGSETSRYGGPAIADLDADGSAEVILGRQVFRADGSTMWVGTAGAGSGTFFSFAVDWDADGLQEVVAGNTVYDTDGSILMTHPYEDGVPAVGDFDGDERPDLVQVLGGMVTLVANDGSDLWRIAVPGGGGGPPTVADFDGDGEPEVGVAGRSQYSVIDTDGSVLWSNVTQDYSSSVTGSSVFDFEGDGDAEVVYADEVDLWVYEGATGAVMIRESGHASGTLLEYPLIVDVDADGATEIVVGSNQLSTGGWQGITVIGDQNSSWAAARPIWNQFAYSITNVNNDGSIPTTPTPNWLTWNNFRAGGTTQGPSGWRPNLAVGEPEVCLDDCDQDSVQLWLPVENNGLVTPTEAVDLVISQHASSGPEVIRTSATALGSGTARYLGPFTVTREEWGTGRVVGVIDPENAIDECDETDNEMDLGNWPCP